MIRSFADRETKELFESERSRRFPPELLERVLRRLGQIDNATCLEDIAALPGNRFHPLRGKRLGQYAIAVNRQWRICFRFEENDAFEVELTDYHSGRGAR